MTRPFQPASPRLRLAGPVVYSDQRAKPVGSGQNLDVGGTVASHTEALSAAGVEMLDAFIIEKIRKEQESRYRRQRIQIEIPRDRRYPEQPERQESDEEPERGVVIIDFSV